MSDSDSRYQSARLLRLALAENDRLRAQAADFRRRLRGLARIWSAELAFVGEHSALEECERLLDLRRKPSRRAR